MNIIVTTGCVASGKSTWAKKFIEDNPNYVRFSRDDVRAMLNGGNPWSHFRSGNNELVNNVENTVTDIQHTFVVSNLKRGRDIIIDETNVGGRTFNNVSRLLSKHDFYVVLEEKPFYIELETALKRDRERTPSTGDDIVKKFFQKLGGDNFKNYKPKRREFFELPILNKDIEIKGYDTFNWGIEGVVITDLDGTLFLFGDKNPYDRDFENDEINYSVLNVIKYKDVIFVSGRLEKYRNQTELALVRALGHTGWKLFMRQDGDMRNDVIVKYEIYRDKIHGKYKVDFVFDDRRKVVNMWRKQGLKCFQVADGEF